MLSSTAVKFSDRDPVKPCRLLAARLNWREFKAGVSALLLTFTCLNALANVSITAATAGGSISADTASNAPSPAWTLLGPIVIAEGLSSDFGLGANVTLVLKAPAGFQFNTAVTPSVTFTNGRDITSASAAMTDSSTITVTLSVGGILALDTLVIGSTTPIQVRPTAGTPLAAGNHLYRPSSGGGSASVAGVSTSSDGSSGSNFGNLTEVGGVATQLTFTTQPAGATAGAAFATQPVIRTQDQFGNNSTNGLAATVNVTATLTSGTGLLQGTTVTNIGTAGGRGIATWTNLRIDVAGSKQLTASASGLTSEVSTVFYVGSGAFTKLQLLMPGEAGDPGSVSGKTGTPSAQTAGTAFNVTVNGVDAFWNTVTNLTGSGYTIHITSSDPNATLPGNSNLSSGTQTLAVTFNTAGAATITATDQDDGTKTASTSPATTINAGAFVKLQLLVPGEVAAPGSGTGKTGTPAIQSAGTAFSVTVNAVDANWNLVSTATDTIGITSSDANVTLPANAALSGGTQNFNVTLRTAGNRTVTAGDITSPGKAANTSPAITVNAATFTKLQLLMPGETAAPGTGSGKTGTPVGLTAGSALSVTVNAVDANWNLINSSDTIHISASDSNATLPANAALSGGTRAFSLTFKTAGSQTVTASDVTDGTKTPNTGSAAVVGPGAFTKMQLLVPGETAAPGTVAGKTGTPNGQTAALPFPVVVNAVDANWNVISTNDTVRVTSSDSSAFLPGNTALAAGTASLNITLATIGTATVTASNVTHATIAGNTSPAISVAAPVLRGGPVVAIHDSELTRALETMAATNSGTPTGAGTTGFEWWPTNWHYFVMPESLKEALASDGTAFEVVSDADISAGRLLTNGQPRYPIVISLASEAVRDDEISQLTNYVAAGGTLMVGSSSFTRQTNGAGRGDFAIGAQMGLHCATNILQNWFGNTNFLKLVDHPLISHFPSGSLIWRLPSAADETLWGTSPAHTLTISNLAWQTQPSDATVLAQGNGRPYLTVKSYGKGSFVYHAGMQPMIAHGGYGPGMYAYRIFRNAIESAFATGRTAVPRVSSWPYGYDAALVVRHDLEDYQPLISTLESSARWESTNGVKGDYYFCTGTLRVEMTNSAAVIAQLRRAVTNYGASIGPHNGGLANVNNTNLVVSDYDYWHWGPDEALNVTPAGYPNGKAYAAASVSNAFNDVEGWLSGITNGVRGWVAPYFNAIRENSYDLQDQLGVKIAGEQKIGPFPHWTLSTQTADKRYPIVTLPVSDWYVNAEIGQSMEAGHNSITVHALIDSYYNLGALINLYSHSLSDGTGTAGTLVQDYIRYSTNKPRIWSTNALGVYNWWTRRSGMRIVPSFTITSNQCTMQMAVSGAVDPQSAVETRIPFPNYTDLQVLTNGAVAGASVYRTNGQIVKLLVGATVTNAVIKYSLNPTAVDDSYTAISGVTSSIAAPGVLTNDSLGLGTNLSAILVSPPAHGSVNLASNGGFDYTSNTNFSGVDSFTYRVNDGLSDGNVATVTLLVTPTASVLFSDNFTRGTDPGPLTPWLVQAGTWTVTGGQLKGGTNALFSYGFAYLTNSWTDYAVEARMQFPIGAFGGGLGGRLNPLTGAHYGAWVYPESSPGGNRVLKLIKFQNWTTFGYNGSVGVPIQQVPLPSVGTNSHRVKMQFAGTQIAVFYDGVEMIRTNDIEAQPLTSGGITADMWTDSAVYLMGVDDVLVTAPVTDQTITFNPPSPHSYADTPFSLGATASSGLPLTYSIVSGPAVTDGTNITLTGIGTVVARASQSGNESYKAALATNQNFTVTQAVLAVTADNKTRTYGATNPALTVTFTGFAHGDGTNVLSGAPALSTPAIAGSPAGSYPIAAAAGTLSATNYTFVFVNGDLEITKALLTVTANNATRGYNLPDPPFTAAYSGFVNGENPSALSGAPALTTTATATSPAGAYPVIAGPGTLASPNYTFAFSNGVLTIVWSSSLFADDFTHATNPGSLSPWVVQSGNWSVTSGELQGGISPAFGYGFAYLTNIWTDYTVQAKVRFPVGAFGGGIGARLTPASGAHYAAWVYPEGSPGGSSILKLIKFQNWSTYGYNGVSFVPIQQVSLPGVGTNWHTITMTLQSNSITILYDGNPALTATDIEAQPYSSGSISADMWTDSSGYVMEVDDVSIVGPPIAQSIAFNPLAGKTYGDSAFALSATASSGLPVSFSVVSGPASLSNNMLTITGAGSVTVAASQAGNTNYAPAADVQRMFNVSPAPLTVTSDSKSRGYGTANPSLTGSISGIQNSDNISATYLTIADTNSPVGTYPIDVGLLDPGNRLTNYSVVTNNGALTVTPATLTISAANKSRAYGQTNPVFTASYSGFVNGESSSIVSGTLAATSTADTNSPVGTYPITVSGQSAPNYTNVYIAGTLTILPADLLVQADNKTRAYGQTNPVLTATITGFVNGENASVLGGNLNLVTTAGTNSPTGNYPILASGLTATNYSITFSNGTLTVAPYALSVVAENKTRAYGASNPPFTGVLTGVQNGDNITATYSTSADTNSPVGNYSIVATLNDPGNKLTNYSVTISNGILSVTPASLTLIAQDKNRTYGATNPPLTGTLTGVQNGDNITASYSTTAVTNSPVADYSIVASLNDADNKLTNYAAAITNGTLHVTPASLLGTGDNKSRSYGQTNPVFTVTYTGFVNGENSSIITGTLNSSSPADTHSPVGNYPIVVSGQTAPNYTITYAPGNLTVIPAELLVHADNKTRPYGQTNPAFTATITGFVNGEDANVLTGALRMSTIAETNSPVGAYTIIPSGLSSTNYSITFSNGTLTVTPYALIAVADDKTRTYGSANPALTGSLTGLQNGDDITASYSTSANTNSPASNYSILVELNDPGNKLTNYSVTISNGTLSVIPAALIVTADSKSRAYGQTNPALTATINGFVNGEDTNALGGALTLSTSADTNSPVGNYPIVAGGLTATNYSITFSNGILTVTPCALSLIADNKSRTYGTANPPLTGTLAGVQNGDNITASYSTTADTDSPVGDYTIVAALNDPNNRLTNYSVGITNGSLHVSPAVLLGTADNRSRAYGQTNPVFTVSYTGFVNGENTSIITGALINSSPADTNSPVGNYPILVSGQTASNYLISYVPGTLTIMPADLLVRADDKNRAYGQTNPLLTATITGFLNGENSSVLGGALTLSTVADTNSPVGNYPIVAGGLTATNYSITFSNGTLTVTPCALSLIADNKSRTYGTANPALTGTLTGVQNGDNITASYSTTADTNSMVGDYPIVAALNDPGNRLTNYGVTISNGTLAVMPRALLLVADDKTRPYGAGNPALTGTLTGVQNNDAITASYATTANTNSSVGNYAITASVEDPGNKLSNYSVTISNGTLSVTAASLSVAADDQARSYGAPNPSFTGTLIGVQNGDNITASYSTTADTNSPVGSYSIVPALNDPDNRLTNYLVISTNGTLSVTNAATTLSLISSQNPSTQGGTVSFSASVLAAAPATATPIGTVQFLTNGTAAGAAIPVTNGAAALQLSNLPSGTNLISAVFSGTPNFAASSNAITQVVTAHVEVPVTLRITDNHDGTVTISGQGAAGEVYILQATDSFASAAWVNVSTNTADTNGFWTTRDSVAGHPYRFYRSSRVTGQALASLPSAILNIRFGTNGTVIISFRAQPEQKYILEAASNAGSGNWTAIATNAVAADGSWTFTEPMSQTARFYRSVLPQ